MREPDQALLRLAHDVRVAAPVHRLAEHGQRADLRVTDVRGHLTSIAGYRVWPGALMLIGLVCLLVCVAASGALRQDDGDRG